MRSFPGMKHVALTDRGAFDLLFLLEHYFPKARWIQAQKAATRARVAGSRRLSRSLPPSATQSGKHEASPLPDAA